MKKILLISGGVLILLLLAGAWFYLVVKGAPSGASQVFSNFGIGNTTATPTAVTQTAPVVNASTTPPSTASSTSKSILRQLTTKPVAGMAFTSTGIRYVERGTGYVYDIDPKTGQETKVSNTTREGVEKAVFAPGGNEVAMVSETNGGHMIFAGTITKDDSGQGVLDGSVVTTHGSDPWFSADGSTLDFIETSTSFAVGTMFDMSAKTTKALFTLPLRDVTMLWGTPTYVAPKPSAGLNGDLYQVNGNSLSVIGVSAPGFMATPYDGGMVYTASTKTGLISTAVTSNGAIQQGIGIIPDKCTSINNGSYTLLCAAPAGFPSGTYPDDWYQGVVTLEDDMWAINTEKGEAVFLSDMSKDSGRTVDATDMTASSDGSQFLFINKVDNSLWMFVPTY